MRFGKVYAMAVVPPCDEIRRRSSPPCLRLPRRRGPRLWRRGPRGGCHCADIDPNHSRRLPCRRVSGASTEGREGSPWSGQPCSMSCIPATQLPHPALGVRRSSRLSYCLHCLFICMLRLTLYHSDACVHTIWIPTDACLLFCSSGLLSNFAIQFPASVQEA